MSIDDTIGTAIRLLEAEYDQLRARSDAIWEALVPLRLLVDAETVAPPSPSPAPPDGETNRAPSPKPSSPAGVPRAAGHSIPAGVPTPRASRPTGTPSKASDERHRKVAEIWAVGGATVASRNRAVAAHFGVSGQAAGQYIHQARRHGFLDAAAAAAPPPAAAPLPVASVAEAPCEDLPMLGCPHCSTTFFSDEALAIHVRRKHANNDDDIDRALAARTARVETPEPPAVAAPDRSPHLLCCGDCPATFQPSELPRLIRHTLAEHGRQPHQTERSPRPNPLRVVS